MRTGIRESVGKMVASGGSRCVGLERFRRATEIARLRAEGARLSALAGRYGITRQRVREILESPPRPRPREVRRRENPVLTDRAVRRLFLNLDYLKVSVRLYNVLKREGILLLGDVVGLSLPELRGIDGLGAVSMGELDGLVLKHDLRLCLHLPRWPSPLERVGSQWAEDVVSGGSEGSVELLDVAVLRRVLGLPYGPALGS